MEKLVVEGGGPLRGEVGVSGAKNAVLPILAAVLLTEGEVKLTRVPALRDVATMLDLLRLLGVRVEWEGPGRLSAKVESETTVTAPYELVSKMRASFCVLGPLLSRRGRAKVSLPGGCAIGVRPIDLHLRGLSALGAEIEVKEGYVEAEGVLKGAELFMGGPFGSSVTGTANVMMAATLAQGKTIIEAAACEPEIQDLARFLNSMGARIRGAGSPRLEIEGVKRLQGGAFEVIGDRIEGGTFVVGAALTGGDIRIRGVTVEHMKAVVEKVREAGAVIEPAGEGLHAIGGETIKAVDVTTLPYPGFPTDMQAQLTAMLSVAEGTSVVTEKIYPDRFMHIAELNRMGARIQKEGGSVVIHGVTHLSGAPVMASDLRASASLVLAGLVARGKTEVHRLYHLDRGYEDLEGKLRNLGANVERFPV
ncbi:MAG: UDP-N-acetylglucosamine 1-carboxyvinyltransferase [Planctomycetota bacterium]|jgi:UDP-N-acetylglucosamine 1-carboxyvinyltransferase